MERMQDIANALTPFLFFYLFCIFHHVAASLRIPQGFHDST